MTVTVMNCEGMGTDGGNQPEINGGDTVSGHHYYET